ncbi:UDP-glucuronosyltransferase 1-2 [Strongylocentrotus purpuratus]|uniref:UDP-glucuronosyltransferase n=1 Tax=Strongylocentrotus purpuratus TaxID=7668 RepID=A0A7M7N9C5_STRPU|nr:UDP-glucuronosyltransferase 1-2 [Strongylocentrotus purpuratus]
MRRFLCFVLSSMIFAIDVIPLTSGADILVSVLSPMPSSHAKGISAITGALTRRGHNVTILTSSSAGTKGFQRNTYNRAVQYKFVDTPGAKDPLSVEALFDSRLVKQFTQVVNELAVFRRSCQCFFEDTAALSLLEKSHFDIIIADAFDGCDAILSSYLEIPYIAVTTGVRYPFFHERLYGIPFPSSYVPMGLLSLSDRMAFLVRVASFMEHHVIMSSLEWIHFGALNEVKDKHGIAPGRSIPDLIGGAELWLCMTNFALDFPRPTAPNWVAIGNIADTPAKPLQKDYASFIEGSGEHGFIIFSLGIQVTELPKEMAEAFARVLSELPQRVIWRYTGTRPRYLGNNTMLVDWMPQNDLLGHPKARLFITHGGLNGITEAVYYAVPMVVMPIFAEQHSNAVKVEVKGMGRRLQKNSISYDSVKMAVMDVLLNQSYRENVQRISGIYRDIQSKPDETVVYWVEHILEFGGSHLRSRALELSFIQLHSIDVLAFIVGIIAVIVFLLCACCKRCISCCSKSKKTKLE